MTGESKSGDAPPPRPHRRIRLRGMFLRIRAPLALAAAAVLILIVLNSFTIEAAVAGPAEIAARMLAVSALGWAVLSAGNWLWGRRLRRLRLDTPDNFRARQAATRLRVLQRMWAVFVVTITVGAALTAIPWARQIGVSIFASAGIAGIAIGIAAQPVLSNLIAGLQIAFTQPMRLGDAVTVEGEYGWIEEIGLFHVVVRLWDRRRLIVPLKYFIDQPFVNWTHRSSSIVGAVVLPVDYRTSIADMRARLREIVQATPLWDGEVCALQVTDAGDHHMEVRVLVGARTAGEAWDLRCHVRELLADWMRQAEALPRTRAEEAAPLETVPRPAQIPAGAAAVRDPTLREPWTPS